MTFNRLPPISNGAAARASVVHLLSRAYSLPCSTAVQAYMQVVQPTSRFQLALDVLLPLLDSEPENASEYDLAQRILVSFLLYSLYAPHPITMNPFKSVLFLTFRNERDKAITATEEGRISENEQLVWVLWKLLKGDGSDIGPYSPSTLASSPLPQELRPTHLQLDDRLYDVENECDDYYTPTKSNETADNVIVTSETDDTNERVAVAMNLLLEARHRVLTLSERRIVIPAIPALASTQMITNLDLAPIVSYNSTLAHPLFVALLSNIAPAGNASLPSPFLDVLCSLPPTLPTFDLIGRLLQDNTLCADGTTTITSLVRTEVLGRFILACISWLDNAEQDERDGLVSDDRFAMGVKNLCRFYNSLVKLSIIDPTAEEETVEMAHFSLRNSRFEEANTLYRMLASGRA